jgi:hypothetical protein
MVVIAVLMIVVLSRKFGAFPQWLRGADPPTPGPPTPKEYVTPDVDKEIKHKMNTLHDMLVPVQYVDNGLLPTIETNMPSVQQALKPIMYKGPEPFGGPVDYTTSIPDFADAMVDRAPADIPERLSTPPMTTDDIEPFNSLHGMVVSEGQMVSPAGAADSAAS